MTDKYLKPDAEKLLYLKEGQYAPNHFHWYKTEDIISRNGGNVLIRVYNSLPNEEIDCNSDATVHSDGRVYCLGWDTDSAGAGGKYPHPAKNLPRFLRGTGERIGFIGQGQSVQ